MIIDRDLRPYILPSDETIGAAVTKIARNRQSVICCVDEHGVMEGLFTNGDLLRWLSGQEEVDLGESVSVLLNRDFLFAAEGDSPERVNALLQKVLYLPILGRQRRLVGVARRRDPVVRLGERVLDGASPTFVIAEIGINHNGSLELAKRLIDAAADAGADCAKFQMRNLDELYHNRGDADDASENLGSQYILDLLNRFQLSRDEMYEAFDYCSDQGLMVLCTPWDLPSVEALEAYGVDAYKVASADLTNHELLGVIAATGKPMICSTGMSEEREILESVRLLQRAGAQYILLNCNSTYPAPYRDVNLRYMDRLAEIGQCLVGYSGHERGYSIPIAAVARGAKVIEKHITLDRDMEGNDHKVSLLPDEFRSMVEGIRAVEEALGTGSSRVLTQGERMNRVTLAKSLVVTRDIDAGDLMTADDLAVKSPGRGLQPNRRDEIVGRPARRRLRKGDFLFPGDLEEGGNAPRVYSFERPWGIPVRFHDFVDLAERSKPDFVEFHLSYKDLELDIDSFVDREHDLGFTVHSPDLFAGDHLLDLAADDPGYRERSLHELQRVIDITRRLKPKFIRSSPRPLVIVSMGGFSRDRQLDPSDRGRLYARIADGLETLDTEGVELIAQTLPPFPWYFGGQLFLNLFVDPDDTAHFCRDHGYRLCFDISHSKLACNHFHWSFSELVDTIGPYTAHLHLADAQGLDGEGLQVGDGEVDFSALADQLDRLAPNASFIPEIWQGHEDGGEGFWVALERLEECF